MSERANYRAAVWRGRYFVAYALTVAAALAPLLLGKMDGPTYSNTLTWLFGALVTGGAASRAAKRAPRGKAGAGAQDG